MTGRGLRGRHLAQLVLLTAIVPDVLAAMLFLTAPNFMGPMVSEPPSGLILLPAFGIALNLAGLAWMIRLYPSDSEARPSAFRFARR